ncbi:MAG: hypothetical protein V4671_20475 [Armatimonadota bacterium]
MAIVFVLVLCLIAAFFFYLVGPRSAQLKQIFSDAHLIEIAEQLEAVKPLAVHLAEVSEAPFALEDDPRAFMTGAGIVLYYTISHDDGLYFHHFSLKDSYGITPHAVGATLVVYVARLFSVSPEILTVERSQQQVFHVSFKLSGEEQKAFARTPLHVPSARAARTLFNECLEIRQNLVIQSI